MKFLIHSHSRRSVRAFQDQSSFRQYAKKPQIKFCTYSFSCPLI